MAVGPAPLNGTTIGLPPHTETLGTGFMEGPGLIVTINVSSEPGQFATIEETVIKADCCTATFAAVKPIFPEPAVPNPIAVLLLDHDNRIFAGWLDNGMLTIWPEQAITSFTGVI